MYLTMLPLTRFLVLVGVADSRAGARRLLVQGAVEANGEKVTGEPGVWIKDGSIIRVGKRGWVKIVNADKGNPA